MVYVNDIKQQHIEEDKLLLKLHEQSLEKIKYHLTCAAEMSEELGLFLKTADIKKVNSDICHMQGKEEDAKKLDYSIYELKNKQGKAKVRD